VSRVHERLTALETRVAAAELMDRCRLGRTRFEQARRDLMDAALLECTATGRPDGAGTPGGGRHSVYRRIIPVPVPV